MKAFTIGKQISAKSDEAGLLRSLEIGKKASEVLHVRRAGWKTRPGSFERHILAQCCLAARTAQPRRQNGIDGARHNDERKHRPSAPGKAHGRKNGLPEMNFSAEFPAALRVRTLRAVVRS